MNEIESDLVKLTNSFTKKELLSFEQLAEFSFLLISHPTPINWVDKIHSNHQQEDLITLLLCIQLPVANIIGQLKESTMLEWQKEDFKNEIQNKSRDIIQRIGYLLGITDFKKLSPENVNQFLSDFFDDDTWVGSIEIIEKNPILLSIQGDFALATMLFSAFLEKDEGAVKYFTKHRIFLAECRHRTTQKVIAEKFPFAIYLHDGIGEAKMFVISGIEGMGYGDIPFLKVYDYAKLIIKNPEGLLNIKLDMGMGKYLMYTTDPEKWEKGKSILENVLDWIEHFGDKYEEETVNILYVKAKIFLGVYWKNKYGISKNIRYIDESIKQIRHAIKKAPVDDDIILIYNGLYKTLFEKYEATKEESVLDNVIEILTKMLDINKHNDSSFAPVTSLLLAGCYSLLYTNHNVFSAVDKSVKYFEETIETPNLSKDLLHKAKSGLGKIVVARHKERNDPESLDIAIKNLTEALDDYEDTNES